MSTTMGSSGYEGMYSKLIDDEAPYLDEPVPNRNPDVGCTAVPVPSARVAPRPSGPGPYRLATICLATLCAVLLISIIAVTAHYNNSSRDVGGNEAGLAQTEGQIHKQKQEANVTALSAALSKLQQEKADLQKERDQLMTRLAAKPATKAPEATRPVTEAAPIPTAAPIVCPIDWVLFNTSCYFISRRSMDWPFSQRYCQERGGHLAIIHTAEEQTFLWERLPRGHWNAFWFGISDEHTEDEWKWVDGTPLVGGFWEDGEPNNHIDEDCGYIVKTRVLERVAVKSWYDAPCSMFWPFICEKEMVNASSPAPH